MQLTGVASCFWCPSGISAGVPVVYINDVACTTSEGSEMNLFADDIALYRVIKSPTDCSLLQDINLVSSIVSAKYICILTSLSVGPC